MAYKSPIEIKVGTTPGVTAGAIVAVFDGTGGTYDWRGLKIIPERIGFGTLKKNINADYIWDVAAARWTWLNGVTFQADEFFHIEFEILPADIAGQGLSLIGSGIIQYPDTLIVKLSNWSNNTESEVEYKGRWETGSKARDGFLEQDVTVKGVFYTRITTPEISRRTAVEIVNKDGETIEADTVKKYKRDQFNAKIWL